MERLLEMERLIADAKAEKQRLLADVVRYMYIYIYI